MPLTAEQLTIQLATALRAQGFQGAQVISLSRGIAQGFLRWMPTFRVQTAITGPSGAGGGTGGFKILPGPGVGTLAANMTGFSLAGARAPALARGVVLGLSSALNSQAQVITQVTGVASGVGVGKLQNVRAAIAVPLFTSSLQASGLQGILIPNLASALSVGLATWLQTGVVRTQVVGTPTVPAVTSVGTGIGIIR
jgi:hypothetical protein